jgi:endonuclease YncB( thermonuclease family)
MIRDWSPHVVFGTLLLACAWAAVYAEPPQPQLVLPCRVISVHDGDTLRAEVTLRADIRLLDCWAPELREAGGAESRAKLTELANGRSGLLTIPLGDYLGDSLTFGRVLGRIEIGGRDVSDEMVASGHAKERKPK